MVKPQRPMKSFQPHSKIWLCLHGLSLFTVNYQISQALDSLLDEIHSAADAKVLRASLKDKLFDRSKKYTGSGSRRTNKHCILCKRPYQHFLGTCKYLPEDDKQYMTKVRQSQCGDVTESDPESDSDDIDHVTGDNVAPNKLRVVSAL